MWCIGLLRKRRRAYMLRKFKITYCAVKRQRSIVMQAFSKYDAKQRFYRTYPNYQIVMIEEADNE